MNLQENELRDLVVENGLTDDDIKRIITNGEIVDDLKDILSVFDERRDYYNEETTKALVDEIAKVVWSVK